MQLLLWIFWTKLPKSIHKHNFGEHSLKVFVKLIFELFRLLFKSKQDLILENLMLRQQLNIYKRKDKRPKLENIDRIILVWISRVFSKWKSALVVAKASTLIGWHRKGFKLYWKRKSRRVGRPNIDWELIKLIRKMQKESPTWSAQRIQGELKKLGFHVCDNTVAKYMQKPKTDPEKRQRWLTFLRNPSYCRHRLRCRKNSIL